MQQLKAIRLSKDWANRLCSHPNIEKEFDLKKETGNMVCTVCGNNMNEKFDSKIKNNQLEHCIAG